ncbi:MAG: hypothetical protein KF709_12420 [Gemmatimonadaceae bacterium]|nr:hypothetical protein [Gemmatimonadaceae bacterium]
MTKAEQRDVAGPTLAVATARLATTRVAAFARGAALMLLAASPVVRAPLAAQAPPQDLPAARAAWERSPRNVDSIIWFGRRTAYTGAFADAVVIYTEGLRLHPDEPHLLRHRGHRYISLRQYPLAIRDLSRALGVVGGAPDEIEPDGQPNARGIPTSTLHGNIRYHLALAYFLTGEFARAAALWEDDARLARNLDHRVAATHWAVIAHGRAGDLDKAKALLAPIRADWDIIENGSYHQVLLWMKGERTDAQIRSQMTAGTPAQTMANGMAQWYLANGRRAEAERLFAEILAGERSASFGYLAAEAARRGMR